MELDLGNLKGKTLFITGGTGMIGKWMVDELRLRADCRIVVAGRSEEKFRQRFSPDARLAFLRWDASHPTAFDRLPAPSIDYVVHLASNTHPVAYATDPVGTVVMNVNATKELLELSVRAKARFVYASSVEIYGQNRSGCERFREEDCGYIDCNTLRAGYPESKRCGEALCQAYAKQYGADVVIPRLARVYGPTQLATDTKALSQFIGNARAGKDIVLKSAGDQCFSYLHVADAVSGILTVMLKGASGEAYNIAHESSDIRLRDLAELVASACGRKVIRELPTATERAGFSPAVRACLDGAKLKALGWTPRYDLAAGIGDLLANGKKTGEPLRTVRNLKADGTEG